MTLVHAMVAGGDAIDDIDVLRSGATAAVLGHRVLVPSTCGAFLRGFTFGHVRQLDRVSDVTGITQELSNERIGASYGDALFAGRAAGLVGDYDDWEEVADTVEPNPANREVYDRLYEVYQQLYSATKEQVYRLAALQLEEGVTPEG
jgi:hypothetical protein